MISTYRWKKWVLDKTTRSIVRIGTTSYLTIKPIHFSYYSQICAILKQLHSMPFWERFSNASVFGWRRNSRVPFPADKVSSPNGLCGSLFAWLHSAAQYRAALFLSRRMEGVLCFKQLDVTALLLLSYLISLSLETSQNLYSLSKFNSQTSYISLSCQETAS